MKIRYRVMLGLMGLFAGSVLALAPASATSPMGGCNGNAVVTYHQLTVNEAAGMVTEKFAVAGCGSVQLTLASYTCPATGCDPLSVQTIFDHTTATYEQGTYNVSIKLDCSYQADFAKGDVIVNLSDANKYGDRLIDSARHAKECASKSPSPSPSCTKTGSPTPTPSDTSASPSPSDTSVSPSPTSASPSPTSASPSPTSPSPTSASPTTSSASPSTTSASPSSGSPTATHTTPPTSTSPSTSELAHTGGNSSPTGPLGLAIWFLAIGAVLMIATTVVPKFLTRGNHQA